MLAVIHVWFLDIHLMAERCTKGKAKKGAVGAKVTHVELAAS